MGKVGGYPDIMIFLVGCGGDGKSLLINGLLRSLFGIAWRNLPNSTMHTPDELRKQERQAKQKQKKE